MSQTKKCKNCGVPIPGKPENQCYNCRMGCEPEVSRRIYAETMTDRKAWLEVLLRLVNDELDNKSFRQSADGDILYGAYCKYDERNKADKRIASCPGHKFSYSFSTSHEHIYECECGEQDAR